ncbi:MAG: hypothetical protein AAGD11_20895 [Planctomycetota bacterium]
MTHVSPRVFLGALLGFGLLAATIVAQQPDGTSKSDDSHARDEDAIFVSRFGKDNVIGHLGHPLGTVVRVTGVAIDGDDTGSKASSGKLLLRVEAVNDVDLTRPSVFVFSSTARGITQPKPGEQFDYYVHEYGAFDGVVDPPPELGIDHDVVAHDGFHYRPHIAIHKAL